MTLELGILIALACAFATNLGFLYKHRGACAAPAVNIRHPFASARALFSSKWFAIGMLVALGAASGILFGVSDIALKALTGLASHGGLMGIVSPWLATAVIASVAAFYASARGLQDGDAVPVIAVTGTAANVAGIAGGIIVFGDPMPSDPVGVIIQVSAFAMVLVAAWLMPAPVRAAGGAAA